MTEKINFFDKKERKKDKIYSIIKIDSMYKEKFTKNA